MEYWNTIELRHGNAVGDAAGAMTTSFWCYVGIRSYIHTSNGVDVPNEVFGFYSLILPPSIFLSISRALSLSLSQFFSRIPVSLMSHNNIRLTSSIVHTLRTHGYGPLCKESSFSFCSWNFIVYNFGHYRNCAICTRERMSAFAFRWRRRVLR